MSFAEETTVDALLDGQVLLKQPRSGFRAAIDSVLLPAATNVASGAFVFELGTGCGAASLCLARRVEGINITGIEKLPYLVGLAGDNIRSNGFEGVIDISQRDVLDPLPACDRSRFDFVMLNPPYLKAANSRLSGNSPKTVANVETPAGLQQWIDQAYRLLRHKGLITMIHRADRLDEIVAALRPKFGGITVCPLWPRIGVPAKRLIVRARKGVATPFLLTAGLVLHTESGAYTPEAEKILSGGCLEF